MASEPLSTYTPMYEHNARCDLFEPPENCSLINCNAKDEQMRVNASYSLNPFND